MPPAMNRYSRAGSSSKWFSGPDDFDGRSRLDVLVNPLTTALRRFGAQNGQVIVVPIAGVSTQRVLTLLPTTQVKGYMRPGIPDRRRPRARGAATWELLSRCSHPYPTQLSDDANTSVRGADA